MIKGTLLKLDQFALHKLAKKAENDNKKWSCIGNFGSNIYLANFGLIIESKDFNKTDDVDVIYDSFYEVFLTNKNVFIPYKESFVVEDFAGDVYYLQSIYNNLDLYLSKKEIQQIPFNIIGR